MNVKERAKERIYIIQGQTDSNSSTSIYKYILSVYTLNHFNISSTALQPGPSNPGNVRESDRPSQHMLIA